jgi:hypothetical protein
MYKKKLVIVILGTKRIDPKIHWLKKIFLNLYALFGIKHFSYYRHENKWKENFYSQDRDVRLLHWGRGFTGISTYFGMRKLSKLINKYKNTHEITIVGYSMGGEVALETAQKFDGIINKVICVFSANKKCKIRLKKTKVINIYSPYDFFVKTAIKILAPITGNQKLIGENITNISLNDFGHDDVFSNKKINDGRFSGKTISELINEFI